MYTNVQVRLKVSAYMQLLLNNLLFRVEWGKPIVANLSGDLTLYSMPPPGSGVLIAYILRVLDGFVQEANSSVQITQRITEAFKHAYGHRTDIGDPRFTNITEVNYFCKLQQVKY